MYLVDLARSTAPHLLFEYEYKPLGYLDGLRIGAQEPAAHPRTETRAVHLVGARLTAGGAQSALAVRRVAAPRLGPYAR